MSATFPSRIQRLRRLQGKLPRPGTPAGECLIISQLLVLMPDCYGDGPDPTRRRAMQRDLDELARDGLIEVVNPGGKPQRYRQMNATLPEDEADWQYVLSHIRDLVHDLLPQQRLDRVWQRLLRELDGPLLDERKLRLVPDTLRLCPPAIHAGVLEAVLTALLKECVLEVLYENAKGERGPACIHPQGLLQRGPTPYLFALKNDETEPLRLYALHRMIRARARLVDPARKAAGFDLDRAIASGRVDFGTGKVIDLELRVRGYVVEVLRACPLTPAQRIDDEPAESPFLARVRARVPETGALWRWLLGLGANVEVVGPPTLRQGIQEQTLRAARLYAHLSVLGEDAAGQSEPGQDTPGHGNPSPACEGKVGA
jgi:predicted DNA-binding transcriptional regulator YafY